MARNEGGAPAGGRLWGWLRPRGDLPIRRFPRFSDPDVVDRYAAVRALNDWAEGMAQDAIDWYLRDKAIRRVGSRLLRASTLLLITTGGVVPLVGVAQTGDPGGWGYVLLAAGGGCAAFDHFFGLSSGWMRDMTAAQSLQRRLAEHRLAWATGLLRRPVAGLGDSPGGQAPDNDKELNRQLTCIREFATDIISVIEAETAEWLLEFHSNLGGLHNQISVRQLAAGSATPTGGDVGQ